MSSTLGLIPRRAIELGPFIVTLRDGATFWCTAEREGDGEPRWIFEATSGTRHVGPTLLERQTPIEVQKIVERWWEEKRAAPWPCGPSSRRNVAATIR